MSNWKTRAVANLIGEEIAWKYLGDELIIYTEGVSAPSDAEIKAEIARLEKEHKEVETAKAAAKAAAEAKLAALGLTSADLQALGL